jgi:hypothetical protein
MHVKGNLRVSYQYLYKKREKTMEEKERVSTKESKRRW